MKSTSLPDSEQQAVGNAIQDHASLTRTQHVQLGQLGCDTPSMSLRL